MYGILIAWTEKLQEEVQSRAEAVFGTGISRLISAAGQVLPRASTIRDRVNIRDPF